MPEKGRFYGVLEPVPFRKVRRAADPEDAETWEPGEVANTLNAFDQGDVRTTHAIVEPIPIQDVTHENKRQNGSGFGSPGDPAFTLQRELRSGIAFTGDGESADPLVPREGKTYTHDGNGMRPRNLVGIPEVAATLRGGGSTPGSKKAPSGQDRATMIPIQGMRVRRLTPRECERLQGFHDDYTLLEGYRKKIRAHEVEEVAAYLGIPIEEARRVGATPDGPRYRALGNSMAVPVMRWIGERLAFVDRALAARGPQ